MRHTLLRRLRAGFTLIELMIVVAIIGILAAVAIPAFMKYLKKSRTAEAVQQLKKLSDGARTYYLEDHVEQGTGVAVEHQFPGSGSTATAPTPDSCCLSSTNKCQPNPVWWNVDPWTSLKFGMTDAHYYWYTYTSANVKLDSQFTARANGDLDCDGTVSTFEMYGTVSLEGEPTTQGGMFTKREIE